MTYKRPWISLFTLAMLLLTSCSQTEPVTNNVSDASDENSRINFIEVDKESNTSMAVVVDDVPLAHTAQFLPFNQEGQLIGEHDVDAQINRVLESLRLALSLVDSDFENLVKVHVYATSNEVANQVEKHFAKAFTETNPAVSFVVGHLPHPGAQVAIDAVATTPRQIGEVAYFHSPELYGAPSRSHVSIMPPGPKIYFSGQVAEGDLLKATEGTMRNLFASLAWMNLDASDIVQLKAFIGPVADAEKVEEKMRSLFWGQLAPPMVSVEWHGADYLSYLSLEAQNGEGPLPIEIELVASRQDPERGAQAEEAVSYFTPPWMTAPATYSRIAEVNYGDLVYFSGMYGDPGSDPERQVRDIFGTLDRLAEETGTDFDHLVKGTYYMTGSKTNDNLNSIRQEFYDPRRAPTSSKMPVRGVGQEGSTISFDMIGVVPK